MFLDNNDNLPYTVNNTVSINKYCGKYSTTERYCCSRIKKPGSPSIVLQQSININYTRSIILCICNTLTVLSVHIKSEVVWITMREKERDVIFSQLIQLCYNNFLYVRLSR